jgi:DnaJ-like protein
MLGLLGERKPASYIVTVAFLLGVLLAGLVVSFAFGPGKLKAADLHRWLGWALVAVPIVFLLLRAGSYGLALAAALVTAALRRGLPVFQSGSGRARSSGEANGAGSPGTPAKRMTRREALEVLGLHEGASKDDVVREYRRLMKRLHPDVGGSSYLATKLNEAREVLS